VNINDYNMVPIDDSMQTKVEYVSPDFAVDERYPVQSTVSIKGRRDFEGFIDRVEGKYIVVKIFDETYSVPLTDFDSIFFLHPKKKSTWYEKLK